MSSKGFVCCCTAAVLSLWLYAQPPQPDTIALLSHEYRCSAANKETITAIRSCQAEYQAQRGGSGRLDHIEVCRIINKDNIIDLCVTKGLFNISNWYVGLETFVSSNSFVWHAIRV